MTSPNFELEAEAQLLTVHIQGMLTKWGAEKPLRTGLHASSVLVPEAEWCARQHILAGVFPEQAERPAAKSWDSHQNAIFLQGWQLHEKWQMLFQKFGACIEAETPHYDEDRDLWFTPDALISFAGQTYVVEIKGYKQEEFEKHTDKPPRAAHLQANLYCHLLGVKKAIILVENKNTQDIKLWVVAYDREMALSYVQRMYDVKSGVILHRRVSGLRHELPARVCQSPWDRLAQKCPMKDLCFSRELEGR